MNPGFVAAGLRAALRLLVVVGVAGALTGCRSDNLWFSDAKPKAGSAVPDTHVTRLEKEWRANDPASYR